jgi:hypothetical protein
MISPSKARVTFRQASHSTARTRSGRSFRQAPCSPQPHSTRPSIRCYSHTHVVKDRQANMPCGTSTPLNQEYLAEGILRSTRQIFVRLVYCSTAWSTLLALLSRVNQSREFFSSRFHPGFATPSQRPVLQAGHHSTRVGSGEDGNRTRDLLLAKQALYQLSYFPDCVRQPRVRVLGFEPRTSALSELRSSQLSYPRDFQRRQTQEPNRRVWLSPTPDCR